MQPLDDFRIVDQHGKLLSAETLAAQAESLPVHLVEPYKAVCASVAAAEAAEAALKSAEADCASAATRLREARERVLQYRGRSGFHELWVSTFKK